MRSGNRKAAGEEPLGQPEIASCRLWVRNGNPQGEHSKSAFLPKAEVRPYIASCRLRARSRRQRFAERYLAFAKGFATARACSMKSCATGLNVRFFNVMIPTGPVRTGNSTGSTLNDMRLWLN